MTIQILIKIGAVGILVALLNQILKHSGKDEHAFLLNLAGLIIVLSWIIPYILELFNEIMELMNVGGIS
jgi:stage III sporulation protein AC